MAESNLHSHALGYSAYAYDFYRLSVTAGTYMMKVQWRLSGGKGYTTNRTLIVVALPA